MKNVHRSITYTVAPNIIFLIACLFIFSIQAHAANLIPNGGFEDGYNVNWSHTANNGGSANFSTETSDVQEGTKALKMEVLSLGSNVWNVASAGSSPLSLASNATYTLTFWAKAMTADSVIRIVQQTDQYIQQEYTLTTSWAEYTWDFTAAEDAPVLKIWPIDVDTFLLDDMYIEDPTSPPPLTGDIAADFESESFGSTNIPSGWNYIDVDPADVDAFVITNGLDGFGKGANILADNNVDGNDLPGAYIVNDEPLDAAKPISGSFDFYNTSSTRARAGNFIMGDVADGITKTETNELVGIRIMTDSFGNRGGIVNGTGDSLTDFSGNQSGATWTTINFTWTPTNGLTGDFSASGDSGTESWTVSHAGLTLDYEEVFFGFGAAGYYNTPSSVIFDNISISGSLIYPPGTVLIVR